MESLERTFAKLYEDMPHLPTPGREWLAKNVWWIALLAAIFGALSILPVLAIVFGIGLIASFLGGPVGVVLSGTLLVAAVVSMTYLLLFTIIAGMAVSPLKARQRKGWDYLFIIILLGLISITLNLIFAFDISSLLVGALGFAIGGYFLFEIRTYFNDRLVESDKEKLERLSDDGEQDRRSA
jgi:uncharacterized membrane protein YhaH (DUF805 family)